MIRRARRRHFPGSTYITLVAVASASAGVCAWFFRTSDPEWALVLLLTLMGVVSGRLREPAAYATIGLSFLNVVLLAAGAILGPFGAWIVGLAGQAVRPHQRPSRLVFNVGMISLIGVASALAYRLAGGSHDLAGVLGGQQILSDVGLPLLVADVVLCLTNAALLSGVIHYAQGAPFLVTVRRVLASSGVSYIGYGIIAILFVIVWYPADVGPFSAVLIFAPLLAARWAFFQSAEEARSHERTLVTLVTALGIKEPGAAERGRRAASLAEWMAEDMRLAPHQIGRVHNGAMLADIGHIAVPTRLLRRPEVDLSDRDRHVLAEHGILGSKMLEGIAFLEDSRPAIRHQHEWFDGSGRPSGLQGDAIPLEARVVAPAARFARLTGGSPDGEALTPDEALRELNGEIGRYDPVVLAALRSVVQRHGWPPPEDPARRSQ